MRMDLKRNSVCITQSTSMQAESVVEHIIHSTIWNGLRRLCLCRLLPELIIRCLRVRATSANHRSPCTMTSQRITKMNSEIIFSLICKYLALIIWEYFPSSFLSFIVYLHITLFVDLTKPLSVSWHITRLQTLCWKSDKNETYCRHLQTQRRQSHLHIRIFYRNFVKNVALYLFEWKEFHGKCFWNIATSLSNVDDAINMKSAPDNSIRFD